MLKNILQLCLILTPVLLFAQPQEATLLGNWHDDSIVETGWLMSRYNEVWGAEVNGIEYGIIGSTEGTHFISLADPTTPTEVEAAFTPGQFNGPNLIHRDYHTMDNYLYIVADEGSSTLQVVDMSGLPETVDVVYDSNDILTTSHNIFIDETSERIYSFGGGNSVQVISIANRETPELLAEYPTSTHNIPYAHDGYSRNDTVYLNNGNQGMTVYDFTDATNPVLLGSLTSYPQSGYNHAGWLNEEGKYYYLADETHGRDIKTIDVCDKADMQAVGTFDAEADWSGSIPHNVIVKCDLLYTSYYYEGLEIFDISDPANPVRAYYYDTYDGPNENGFAGSWGVFPFLPSGNILLSDLQGGLFVFAAVEEDCSYNPLGSCAEIVNDVNELPAQVTSIELFPQPATSELNITIDALESLSNVQFSLRNTMGQIVQSYEIQNLSLGENKLQISIDNTLSAGFYLLNIQSKYTQITRKIVIKK